MLDLTPCSSVLHEHGLTLPHPEMHRRAFVLQPLLEIAPDCVIPGVGLAAEAMRDCEHQRLLKIGNRGASGKVAAT